MRCAFWVPSSKRGSFALGFALVRRSSSIHSMPPNSRPGHRPAGACQASSVVGGPPLTLPTITVMLKARSHCLTTARIECQQSSEYAGLFFKIPAKTVASWWYKICRRTLSTSSKQVSHLTFRASPPDSDLNYVRRWPRFCCPLRPCLRPGGGRRVRIWANGYARLLQQ